MSIQNKVNKNRAVSFRTSDSQFFLLLNETLPWTKILAEVSELTRNPKQKNKARNLNLELGKRFVTKHELVTMVTLLQEIGYIVTGINCDNNHTKLTVASLTLNYPTSIIEDCEKKKMVPYFPGAQLPLAPDKIGSPAVYIPHSVESGNRIHSRGQLVIAGTVSKGATVMADGDIMVWGELLGKAYAGMAFKQNAVIRVLSLKPEFVSIGEFQLVTGDKLNGNGPCEIRIIDNCLVVFPLEAINSIL